MTLHHREAAPEGEPRGTVLLLHGYPESSHMWRGVLPAITAAGYRAVAPDLAGLGDSPPDLPATWERHVASVQRFVAEQGLERVVLVVHDWGGLIGLAWACEHPGAVEALVISDTGFFADGKWHGMGQAMRTEGQGEQLVEGMTREGLGGLLTQISPGMREEDLDEYWKGFEGEERRRAQLDFYRSMDFEKLAPYKGRLAALGVPTLLLWGGKDEFAPVAGAHRFKREIPHAELEVVEEAGHFVYDDAPEATAAALGGFLGRLGQMTEEPGVSFGALDPDSGERFQALRRQLGVRAFGMNLITLRPRERGRIHAHEHQEEVFLVLEGELTLGIEGEEHALGRGALARVAPTVRRQLVNRGPERLVLLALGGAGEHVGRDGRAWESWEDGGEGRAPQEVPLPDDLPG